MCARFCRFLVHKPTFEQLYGQKKHLHIVIEGVDPARIFAYQEKGTSVTTGGIGDVAAAHLDTQNYRQAADVLRSALATDPHDGTLLANYARACLGLRDYGEAVTAAHAALAVAPDNEHAMRLYTLALHGQGRLPDALSMAWRTVSKHPQAHLAQYTYASLLHESGHDEQALAVINEALRLHPAAPDALVLRGDIYRTLWGASAAETEYLEALRLQPNHASAMHNLAVSRLRWGKLNEAVHGLLAAGRLDPALVPMSRQNIGMALIRVLRMATAAVVFLAVALIVVMAAHQESHSTVMPRALAAVLALGLAAVVVWVGRTVPGSMLLAVLRDRLLLAARLVFVVLAVLIGLVTAAVGSTPLTDVTGPVLLIGMVGLTVAGWVFGQ